MNPKFKRYIKKYYRLNIDKGELKAHNNSHILKKELKRLIQDLKKLRT